MDASSRDRREACEASYIYGLEALAVAADRLAHAASAKHMKLRDTPPSRSAKAHSAAGSRDALAPQSDSPKRE
jgi:hypothetical protein